MDENCYSSHPGILAKHVFVRFLLFNDLFLSKYKTQEEGPPWKCRKSSQTRTVVELL